ncbi:MAG: hypothetical protein OEV31_04920 [Gammaproteobacteria bacterium]|nr:hypothetical protein [Gammaproteobacteria bacterium]
MQRRILAAVMATMLVFGLSACGSKEKEELRQKVASLEQQLAQANGSAADLEQKLKKSEEELEKCQAAAKKKTTTTTKSTKKK